MKNNVNNQIYALGREKKKSRNSQRDKRNNEEKPQHKVQCKFCRFKHVQDKNECPAYGKTCNECGKRNHFSKMCASKSKSIHAAENCDLFVGTVIDMHGIMASDDEWQTTLKIEEKDVKLKLDTGAKCNVLPKSVYDSLQINKKLIQTNTKLIAYCGDTIEVMGEVFVNAVYKSKSYRLVFYVRSTLFYVRSTNASDSWIKRL